MRILKAKKMALKGRYELQIVMAVLLEARMDSPHAFERAQMNVVGLDVIWLWKAYAAVKFGISLPTAKAVTLQSNRGACHN